jgi:hypothetical protein
LDNKAVDEDSEFYSIGTPEDILPGFSSRLSSKDSFSIDVNPTEDHEVYFSTGSAVTSIKAHPGISYFNFNDKKWQALGSGSSWPLNRSKWKELDYISSDLSIATGSYLAFVPSPSWGRSHDSVRFLLVDAKDSSLLSLGKPTSYSGFPLASKFDPIEGQSIKLNDYINGPFLVEKIVLEVSGALGAYPAFSGSLIDFPSLAYDYNCYSTGHGIQFFALIQNSVKIEKITNGIVDYADGTSNATLNLKEKETYFNQKNIRNIVFSSNVVTYPSSKYSSELDFRSSKFGSAYDKAYPINLSSGGEFVLNSNNSYYTGSIKIETKSSIPFIGRRSIVSNYTRINNPTGIAGEIQEKTNQVQIFGEAIGGRNLFDISNGRSYIKSVQGLGKPIELDGYYLSNIKFLKYPNDDIDSSSPMLIFPEDELIVGVANQPFPSLRDIIGDNNQRNEHRCSTNFKTKIFPGL